MKKTLPLILMVMLLSGVVSVEGIKAQCLSGTYTIGDTTNGLNDFESFYHAVIYMHTVGVCGPVEFLADTGIYQRSIVLGTITGSGPLNPITFKGIPGDSTQVELRNEYLDTSATIWGSGTSYITFQSITIRVPASTVSASDSPIRLDGCSHYSFLNCRIIDEQEHGVIQASRSNNIRVESSFLSGGPAVLNQGIPKNNGFHFINNHFSQTHGALFSLSSDSIVFSGNKVRSLHPLTSGFFGLYLDDLNYGLQVIGNSFELEGMNGSTGIFLMDSWAGAGMYPLQISNNFFTLMSASDTGWITGIDGYINGNTDIIHNTFNLPGDSAKATGIHLVPSGTMARLRILNNIIRVENGPVLYLEDQNLPVYSSITDSIDYNAYYSGGPVFARYNGNLSSLSALQAASGRDLHSFVVNTAFQSPVDLHLSMPGQVQGLGIPWPGIINDIDSDPRAVPPTIGADEPIAINNLELLSILLPDTAWINQPYPVDLVIRNPGLGSMSNFQLSYKRAGIVSSVTIPGPLLPNQTDTFTLMIDSFPYGSHHIDAWVDHPSDSIPYDDSLSIVVHTKALYDVMIAELIQPIPPYMPRYSPGFQQCVRYMTVKLRNMGSLPIDTIPMEYLLNSNQPVICQWTGTLLPGQDVVYQHTSPFILPIGASQFTLNTQHPKDYVAGNNHVSVVFSSYTCPTGLDEVEEDLLLEVYPNPASNVVTLRLTEPIAGIVKLTLCDIQGKSVYDMLSETDPGSTEMKIHLPKLRPGVYWIQLESDGIVRISRLVIAP
jgi:hypothetical protein